MNLNAQENDEEYRTLFAANKDTKVSGFGGLITEFSAVNNEFAFSMGGEGAVLFNQSLYFGGYGIGMVNFPTYELTEHNSLYRRGNVTTSKNIIFGHGGLMVGFIFRPNKPLHFGVSSKFGWGAITLIDEFYKTNYFPQTGYHENMVDPVFVFTPQLELEMNFTSWFKLNLGVGYRVVTGVDATYVYYNTEGPIDVLEERRYFESDAFNSMAFSIGFLFGGFK